ncbi:phage tail tape measure protein [Paenibacillus chitinolyticus]|uniref:phage tail tape measure protein n=1 Tax=Paenibacillus chitinolyticus TaxID=79263 RepID=UPI00366A560E
MSNDLRILISAGLNIGKSTNEINNAVKLLENKINNLNLNIQIDKNLSRGIQDLIISVEKMKKVSEDQNKVVSESQEVYKRLDGSVQTLTQKVLKNGEVISKTRTIHDENKRAIQDEETATKKLTQGVEQLNKAELDSIKISKNKADKINGYTVKSTDGYKTTTNRLESDGSTLINSQAVTNYKKQREDLIKEQERLNKKSEELDRAHYSALKDARKREEELEKTHYLALQQNQKRDQDYLQSKANMQNKLNDIQRRFGADTNVNKQIENLNNQLSNVSPIGNYKNALSGIDTELKKVVTSAKTAGSNIMGFGQQFAVAIQRIPLWMGAMTAFYFPLRQFQEGLKSILEIDTALTNLKKVTDETSTTYAQFVRESGEIANSVGNLTANVIESATEWARLGYNIQQAKVLAKETLVYQNVGDIKSAEDASKSLISTIKGFGMEVDMQGKNVRKIVDIYNEVGNKFAISSAGIGEAMRRSAASLSEAGNTIEQAVALATGANSTIQDPARVGQALKTISMRLRGISEEGEDLSNLVPSLEEKFQSIGLTLQKDENTFKSTYEIFQDLSKVWGKLSEFERSDILELVAGKLQGNIAASLISNFKDAEGALQAGLNSFGSAAKENETYLKSMQGHIAKLKNEATNFWQSTMDSGALNQIIDLGTSLIGVLRSVTDTFGGLGSLAGVATAALIAFNVSVRSNTVGALSQSLANAALQFKSLSWFTNLYTSSAVGARVATIALQATMTMGLSIAVAGLISGLTSLYQAHQKNKDIQDQVKAQNEQIAESWNTQQDKIQPLLTQYRTLNALTNEGKTFSSPEQEQKYLQTVNDLSTLLPNLVARIDEKGQKHLLNADAIERELKYTKELAQLERQGKVDNAKSDFSGTIEEIEKAKKSLNKLKENLVGEYLFVNKDNIKNIYGDVNAVQIKILNKENEIALKTDVLKNKMQTVVESFLKLNNIDIPAEASKNIANVIKSLDVSNFNDSEKMTQTVQTFSSFLKLLKENSGTEEAKNAFNALKDTLGLTDSQVSLLRSSFDSAKGSLDNAATSAINLNTVFSSLTGNYKTASDQIKPLNQLIDAMGKGKKMTADEVAQLSFQVEGFTEAIIDENGQIKNNVDAVINLRDEKIQAYKDQEQGMIDNLNKLEQTTIQELKLYGIQVEGIKSVAEALGEISTKKSQVSADIRQMGRENDMAGVEEATKTFDVLFDTEVKLGKIEAIKKRIEGLANTTRSGLEQVGMSEPAKDKKAKEKKAKTKSEPSPYDESEKYKINEYERALQRLDDELRESEAIINRYPDTSKDYRDELTKQIEIRKKMQALAHNEAERLRSEISDVKNKIAVGKLNQKQENDLLKQLEQKENNLSQLSNKWWDYQVAVEATQKKITESIAKYNKEQFDISKNWIDQEKYYKRLSLDDELAAWQRVQARYEQGSEERLNADKEVYRVRQELLSKYEEDFNKVMEKTSQATDETIEKLRKKLETKETFNPSELTDSVDAIMASIDMIDRKYPNGFSPIDTSDDARVRLNAYKANVTALASNMKSMMEMPYNNADQLKNMIDGQIMFAGNIKKLMNETNSLIKQTETAYRMQEASLENQIKLHQQRNDKIIEGLNKALEVKDTFNTTDFSTSINSILSALDALDGKYVKGNFVESTLGTREDLESYKKKVTEIAEAIKNYQNSADFSSSSITEQTKYINGLKTQIDSLNDSIRFKELQYKNEEEALVQLIKAKEKSYDDEINKQKETLKNLDEQIDKEDRLKKLKDINDELDKVKNDKRFSYINADGKEILTYDKGKVAELEKQRDDLLKQYEREDVKKALQDSIDQLEKTKNETIQKLQEQLDKTKVIHQNELESQKLYVKSLEDLYRIGLQDVQNKIGQLKSHYDTEIANEQARLDTLRQVHQSELDSMNMYAGYLSQLNQFLTQDTQTKIDALKTIYDKEAEDLKKHLKEMVENTKNGSIEFHKVLDEYKNGAISRLDSMVAAAQDRLRQMQAIMAAMASMSGGAAPSSASIPKYHTGGIVGSAPLASNEVPAILKLGEEVFTQDHIAKLKSVIMQPINFVGSILGTVRNTIPDTPIRNNQAMAGPTYNLSNFTIQANNPTELFSGLNNLIKSNRT